MELLNLQNVFNEKLFRIPDYQRGYSWEKKQCEDLWRDINNLRDKQDHYTGVLSVDEEESAPEYYGSTHVSIVDGQQRITTLIILINVILKSDSVKAEKWINGKERESYVKKYLFREMGKRGEITAPIFGYDKDNPSHVYFQTRILGLNPMDSDVPSHTLYTRNLEAANKFFADKIEMLPFDKVEEVLRKVTEQLKFNYYQIDNELNKFVAFDAMNNRGKQLSDLEMLKNRLIHLSTLLYDNDDEERKTLRTDINHAWRTIYEYLGKSEKNPLDDDTFLRDHWIMKFGYGGRSSSKVYKEFLLNNYFTVEAVNSGPLNFGVIRDYAQDIQRAVKSYFFLHNPEHSECPYSADVKYWLAKLKRLGYVSFNPLIMSMLTHLSMSPPKIDDSVVVDVLKAAERFYFAALFVHGFQTNKKNNHIYDCAKHFHRNPGIWDSDRVKSQLTLESLWMDVSSNASRKFFCDGIMKKNLEGFYKWRGLHYFLYEYEVSLQEELQEEEKLKWEDINSETIEHIYPQTPANGWEKLFVKRDEQFLLHDLGNLLLLSRKINSEIQNAAFTVKASEFSNHSHSAIEVSRYSEWTPDAVNERREKLLDFLWERWGLQEPTE